MTHVLKFARQFTKLREPAFSTIRLKDAGANIGDSIMIQHPDGSLYKGRLLLKHQAPVHNLPTEFLMGDTDTRTRDEAVDALRGFYPNLKETDTVTVLRVQYEEYPIQFLARNLRVDCYMAVLEKFRGEHPEAHFEIITRKGAESPLSPSWGLLNLGKSGKITFEEYNQRLRVEILARPEALQRMRCLRNLAKSTVVFLVCFEKDPALCHRTLVRQLILEGGC